MRSSMSRAIVVVAMAALFAGAAAAGAGASNNVKTKVKITEGGATHFEGTVSAKKAKCEKKRKVQLQYQPAGTYKGGETVLFTVKTDADGSWGSDGSFTAGLYRAVVEDKHVGNLECRAAVSVWKQF